ncbi:MAG: sulfate transporter [Lacrimispora sp.]|uniref:sulfate transporter n=1 Tax=Lacrimispora sp. TaxID=2719234 RepID=UPI0039E5914A
MKEKGLGIKKIMARLLLVLMVTLFAGAAPGTLLVSHAEVAAAAEAAVPATQGVLEHNTVLFLTAFFVGLILLIIFVVVAVVSSIMVTDDVFYSQEN